MNSCVVVLLCAIFVTAKVLNYETDFGAKADDDGWDTVIKNGKAMNMSLATLKPGDTLIVPNKLFYLMGGIQAHNLADNIIQIDGTLEFATTTLGAQKYIKDWPRSGPGSKANVHECFQFDNLSNVTFTSSSEGTLDGAGGKWWGIPGIGYLLHSENRPRLMRITQSKDVVIEKLYFKDAPKWTFYAEGVENIVVRYSRVEARRDKSDSHDTLDLTAFNTDGFDFARCRNVHVHDCTVWNQDDCFDVKDGTSDVVVERVNASGLGLTIGSISSNVNNITFRDSHMHHTYKGIYMKFRGPGSVSNVLYENIVMDQPEQWAIWIGPAQQCDGCSATELCSAHPCSLCWPSVPGTQCLAPADAQYTNITLRNITINSPKQSAGVLIANSSSPMKNIVFDNVVVNNPADKPWGKNGYYCKNVKGVATGATSPVPPCLTDLTDRNKEIESL